MIKCLKPLISLFITAIVVTSCIDDEIKNEIDFKDPVITIAEDSTVTITIKSNALLSSKDTIYLKIAGGSAEIGSDILTNVPVSGDTIKVYGSGSEETTFTIEAVYDFETEETENLELEIVKFTKGLRNGLHRTVEIIITDKEFSAIHWEYTDAECVEENDVTLQLTANRILLNTDTVFLTLAPNQVTLGTDLTYVANTSFYVVGDGVSNEIELTYETLNDCAIEGNESFNVSVSGTSKGLKMNGEDTSTITIIDYDHTNYCINFDGIDDYVNLGNIYDDLALPVTVEAWVFVDPAIGYAYPVFFSQDNLPLYNGVDFAVRPTSLSIGYGDGLGENNSAYRRNKGTEFSNISNKWTHVAGVMRGATDMDLYINGVNAGGVYSGTTNNPMNSNSPNDVAKIGYWLSNGITSYFKGKMDELRVWNRALTQEEIVQHMCGPLTGNETGLIGYWTFDEPSGNVVNDKSTNGFHGTAIGNPTRVRSTVFTCNLVCD